MSDATKLALLGGPPAVPIARHASSPRHGRREALAMRRALLSPSRDLGDPDSRIVSHFERSVAEYHGVAEAVAASSDTAALWAALVGLGVAPGDNVIVSELAGPAAHAIVMAGARPRFCDVDGRTGNLDYSLIGELVDARTSAVLVTHANGLPADLEQIHNKAKAYMLPVVADATQAFGARYRGKPVAGQSTVGVVSAHAHSPLAASGGALAVTDNNDLADAIRRATRLGLDWVRPGIAQYPGNWPLFFGHDAAMSPLDAALGLTKLPGLDANVQRAQHNARMLVQGLRPLPGVLAPHLLGDRTSTHHAFPVRLDAETLRYRGPVAELRDRVVLALQAEGVRAGVCPWRPLSQLPIYCTEQPGLVRSIDPPARHLEPWTPFNAPAAARLFDETIVLGLPPYPLHAQRPRLMTRYVTAFHKVMDNLDALRDADLDRLRPAPPIPDSGR